MNINQYIDKRLPGDKQWVNNNVYGVCMYGYLQNQP